MSIENPSSDWKEEGFESADQYLSVLKSIKDNRPRDRANFKARENKKGSRIENTHKGIPVFIEVEGHELDSVWMYPVINTVRIAGI